jgi:LmbE family N-acetylglucosaminyl deacetylase
MSTPLTAPTRALAIGAHPDDIEFGCGATLARWARRGTDVHLLILTDGSKGSWDATQDLDELIRTRRTEAIRAAATLARGTVHFGDRVDGEFANDEAARRLVCRIIRSVRPDVVLGHDPWQRYRLHPDHRHAGFATIDGLVAARDPHFFPGDGGAHHRPRTLLLFEADEPNHEEYAAAPDLRTKVDALLCHRSQWRSTMGIDADADDAPAQIEHFADTVRGAARHDGPPARTVERFRLLDEI